MLVTYIHIVHVLLTVKGFGILILTNCFYLMHSSKYFFALCVCIYKYLHLNFNSEVRTNVAKG